MNYLKKTLSKCHIGLVLVSSDYTILDINEKGDQLLHGGGALIGQNMKDIAPMLCQDPERGFFENITFGEYLKRIPSEDLADLKEGQEIILFQDATKEACHDALYDTITNHNDSMALYDAKGRLWMLNDAAILMESLDAKEVIGKHVTEIYKMVDGEELTVTKVLRERKPYFNIRSQYIVKNGRKVDVIYNNYPLYHGSQLIGVICIMKDWSKIDSLGRQVMQLQDKIASMEKSSHSNKPSMLNARYHFSDIAYGSDTMGKLIEQCKLIAKTDSSVMIYGETGTGKELFAQSIHNASSRADRPFLAINCAAIPENLLESMLFGTKRGAFTGAENQAGLFEQANGGTLLLDEINSMDINLQAKLLRVLQEGRIRRVGDSKEIEIDVRMISNINIPPKQAVEEGLLRQDLFYRLGVINISIPPLRERKDVISLLTKQFIIRYNKKMGRHVRDIDDEVLAFFHNYSWPGNVRELQHCIEYSMNVLPDEMDIITRDYISQQIINEGQGDYTSMVYMNHTHEQNKKVTKGSRRVNLDYDTVIQVLTRNRGNISASAKELEMSRQNFQYYIKKHEINPKLFA